MRKTFLFILALCAASAAWGATTVTKTAKEISEGNGGWTKGTAYHSAVLDDVITVTTPSETTGGVYYNGDYKDTHDWRMYQARTNGQFTIKAAEGYVITSVTLTYEVTNTGVVSTSMKESGVATPAANQILSGTAYPFANSEITFYVGNTTAATDNGQARIRKFSVTYEKGIYEDFKDPNGTDWNFNTSATSVEGKYYSWTMANARHNGTEMEKLKSGVAGVGFNGNPATGNAHFSTSAAEGGVKYVTFLWNQCNAKETNIQETLKLTVGDKSTTDSFTGKAGSEARGADRTISFAPEVKTNAIVSIERIEGARVTFGPITIVPYLRYTYTEMQEVKIGEGTFDCSLQIDNTDGGTITYSSDNTDVVSFASESSPIATLKGGGEATITATWSEASTSFKLKVIAKSTPEISFENEEVTITDLYTTDPVANALTVTKGAGEVTYTSSNPLVAQIVENQVMVVGVGTATITATAAENEDYVSASASYALTVNEPTGETAVKENFKGKLNLKTSYTDTDTSFTDQLGLYRWKANGYRYNETWVRLKTTEDPYLKFDGNQEGGIKRLIFTWFRAGKDTELLPIHTSIKVMDGDKELKDASINLAASADHINQLPYNCRIEVKQSAQLVIDNKSTDGAVMHFQDIKIVPYLLFTTKSDEAFLSLVDEYDIKDVLINNTDDDGTVAYSILTDGVQSQISNEGVVDFTNVTKSETITIQAAWTPAGKSSATVTTTMTLYVDVESKTDKTVKEEFSNYGETGWASSEANEVTKNGDVYDWRTQLTRHKTSDKLVDNQQAIWFAQGGYVATADATDNTKVGPAEGGIKRIAFDWNQNGADQTGDDLYISISVDDTEMSAIRRDGGAQPEQPWQYIHNLNVKKNATLKIENKSTASKSEGGRVKIGTIVITPYLLYTVKDTAIDMTKVATFTNDQLINNRDDATAIGYSIVGENDDVASINAETGVVTCLKAGTVTVQAKWGDVTTTYMLTIKTKGDVDAKFATEGKVEKVLADGSFTNAVVVTAGEAIPAYESDNTNVAEVDAEGKVTIKGIGTATITATMVETDNFLAWEDSYTVIVRTGVADDDKLVESFSGISKDASTSETEWKGDLKDYFSWKVKSTRHIGTAGDTIGGAGVAGTVLFAKGQIVTDGVIEGGIKYFTFNWKQPYVEQGATLRLTLNAGDKAYQQDYVVATDNGSTTHEHLYFAGNMQVKKNVQLTLKNESFKTESDDPLTSNGRIAIDKFEIVPYLFYKTKSHKIDVVGGDEPTWTNENLINNTEDGTIKYTIEDVEGEGVAEIDADNGQVTAKSNGKAKVTATWTPADAEDGEVVTTTYEVEVFYSKLDAELAFDPEEITVGEDAIAFSTPTLSNPHGLTVTYSSDNEDIATVDETTGEVTLKHVAGDVVISATSDETDTYQEGKASYTIHVLPLPDVTFPNLMGNTKTVDMDQVPFTETILIKVNEEVVTSSATITYESSNEEVAIIKDNEVNIIGVGTAYITAKIAPKTGSYAGRDVYYTLTVEDNTPAGKQWTETFSSIGNVNDYITSRKADIVGDSSIYSWAMRNYRRRQTQADSLATEQAIRLSNAKNNYIETLNNQEGGIKRISFNWRTPGTEEGQLPINLNVSVCYNNNYQDTVKRPMTRAKSKDNMTDNLYCSNFFVKQNAKLKIDIADETYSVMLIGPITITPYLLYTTKTVEKTYVEGGDNTIDVTENLINNLEDGEAVTYTLSDGAQAQIDGSIITLANATEDVTVTAKWTDGDNTITTTFTLKVTAAEDPDPEPDFVRDDLSSGQLITVCLDKNITSVEGGTFYQIEQGTTSVITFAEFAEEEFPIAKATPLLFQSDGTTMKVFCGTDQVADGDKETIVDYRAMKGLVQTATAKPSIDSGNILVNNGQLRLVGANCVLTPGHAYIDVAELAQLESLQQTPSGAPRRTIRLYNPDAAPTNLNGLNGAVKPMKVLRDGQLYIIRDTKTYNAQGIEVQ